MAASAPRRRAVESGHESVGLALTLDVLEALGSGLGIGSRPALRQAPGVLLLHRTGSRP